MTSLILAVKRLGRTRRERAAALGLTYQQMKRWEKGGYPRIIDTLMQRGVIAVTPDSVVSPALISDYPDPEPTPAPAEPAAAADATRQAAA